MFLTRREWLKRVGLVSAGLWLGSGVTRYSQTLAQSTSRKLALLVGINQYPKPVPALKGCVTDVELHQELLIHQYGFVASDVLTLTDEAATRGNIEAAFTTHLSEQARPGDIVVFHFSGYGCLVRTQRLAEGDIPTHSLALALSEQQALIPVDGWVPNVVAGAPSTFNGIYEDTLFLLLRSLLTDQVTTILDTGVQPAVGLRSRNIRERALPLQEIEIPSAAEFAIQDRLLSQVNLTRDQLQAQRQAGQLSGLVLTAATIDQPIALELDWPEFSAGLFSYGLTQQLWGQGADNMTVSFNRLSSQMAQRLGEIPQPTVRGQRNFSVLPWAVEFSKLPQTIGKITSTNRNGQTGKVWLGGLRAEILELYQPRSCFRVIRSEFPEDTSLVLNPDSLNPVLLDSSIPQDLSASQIATGAENSTGDLKKTQPSLQMLTLVQLRSRRGLTAICDRYQGSPLKEGDYLAEAIRVLPKSIALSLALGSNLNRIERVDATSFISMENKSLHVVGDSKPADYIFTKISAPSLDGSKPLDSPSRNSSGNSYGLAYLSGALLPNTAVTREGVVKLALQKLLPTLETLLALKLLMLSVNEASTLHVTVTLEQVEPEQPLIRLQTPRLRADLLSTESDEVDLVPKADQSIKTLTIPSGTVIRYQIENRNSFPVYAWLVGIDHGTTMFSSYAKDSLPASAEDASGLKPLVIQPGTSVSLPTASQEWKTSSIEGLNQAFLFITRQPLDLTLATQSSLLTAPLPNAISGFISSPHPLAVVYKLFEDLHQASIRSVEALNITPNNAWALDTEIWSSLQFVYRTV